MLLPLTFSSVATAQDDFQKIFDEFKKANEKAFADFRDKANAEYSEFLRQSWIEFQGKEPLTEPEIKPIVPPVDIPEEDGDQDDKEIRYEEEVVLPEPSPAPTPIAPIKETPVPETKRVKFSRYGTECAVRYDVASRPVLRGVDEDAVADFWNLLSSSDAMDNLLYDLMEFRERRSLCDWAFYKFAESFSNQLYGDNSNASVVMHAFILTQAGYKLRMGCSEGSQLHLIVASDNTVFGCPYWEFSGSRYYLFDNPDITSMYISEVDFTASRPMRLVVDDENNFEEKLSPERRLFSKAYQEASVSVSVNLNLLSFYNDYPVASTNDDTVVAQWLIYGNTPLSQSVRESLYSQFRPMLSGKTQHEAADMILNFVQTAFVYKYDDEIWGRDRSFFAEESLYYPYCDCEDRSILFSHLIRDLLGLDVALIYSPGHLFTAVHFTEDVKGSYIMIGNRKFVICEPTCTSGAPVGVSAVDTDEAGVKVGLLRKIDYGEDYRLN